AVRSSLPKLFRELSHDLKEHFAMLVDIIVSRLDLRRAGIELTKPEKRSNMIATKLPILAGKRMNDEAVGIAGVGLDRERAIPSRMPRAGAEDFSARDIAAESFGGGAKISHDLALRRSRSSVITRSARSRGRRTSLHAWGKVICSSESSETT